MTVEQGNNFPWFFVTGLLDSLGLPHRSGLLGPKVVPAVILSAAVTQMVQASIGIGAGHPRLACQLLMQLFADRDWASQTGDDFFSKLDPHQRIHAALATKTPWDALTEGYLPAAETASPVRGFRLLLGHAITENDLPPAERVVSWHDLHSLEVQFILHSGCSMSTIWGLAHPDLACLAFNADRQLYRSTAPELQRAGANIPLEHPFDTNEAFFDHAARTLHAYEATHGPLPQPAGELLAARVVRDRLK